MGFALKRSQLFAILAVLCTAGLFFVGNGMNPWWPFLWVAPIPILLLAAETRSWLAAGAGTAVAMLLGSLAMLNYLHFVLRLPVTAWLIPYSLVSVMFATGVLLFRALLRR